MLSSKPCGGLQHLLHGQPVDRLAIHRWRRLHQQFAGAAVQPAIAQCARGLPGRDERGQARIGGPTPCFQRGLQAQPHRDQAGTELRGQQRVDVQLMRRIQLRAVHHQHVVDAVIGHQTPAQIGQRLWLDRPGVDRAFQCTRARCQRADRVNGGRCAVRQCQSVA